MDPADLQEFTDEERKDLLEAETRMYSQYFEGSAEDRKPMELGILGALLIHIFILYVTFPEFKMSAPSLQPSKIVYVQSWRPPPPPQKEPPKPVKERKLKTKKIPIPDPTPEEPEPIVEPEPEPEPEPLPPDAIALIGIPAPPPVAGVGPAIAGVNATVPVVIQKITPTYPEMARRAGIQGKVFLQAIIDSSGNVTNAAVISCTVPDVGFEQAAVDAVLQWKYKPGEQNGQPVDVLLNVAVDFTLQ
jgi:protein TonB